MIGASEHKDILPQCEKNHNPKKGFDDRSSEVSPDLVLLGESSSHAENRQAQALKRRYKLLATARKLLPDEGIAKCNYAVVPGAPHVVGRYNATKKTASYVCLMKCKSYSCPSCAHRRSEEDRHELSVALAEIEKRGLHALLITLTLSHHQGDKLEDLREALNKAFDATFSGRWYNNLVKELGIAGKLKAWEVTYGLNGMHPHLHVLMVMDFELANRHLEDFTNCLKERWIAKLKALGFDASWQHGLDVRTAQSDIADYISKFGREPVDLSWGAESEIAKAPVKSANRDGLTPFELLAAASGDEEALERSKMVFGNMDRDEIIWRTGALYVEIFYAFKQKPRLFWGGLKQLLDLDQALAEYDVNNPPEPPQTVDMVKIPRREEWGKVLARELRAELLLVIKSADAYKVLEWLEVHGIYGIVPEEALRFTDTGEIPTQLIEALLFFGAR